MKEWKELQPYILSWGRIYSKSDAGEGDDSDHEKEDTSAATNETKVKKLPGSFLDAKDACSTRLDIYKRNFPELQGNSKPRSHGQSVEGRSRFLVLAHGLKKFRETHNVMPISGTISDFTATTDMYRELQTIFKAKAEEDALEIHGHVVAALTTAGRPHDAITLDSTKEFCAHAWELNHVVYPTFERENTKSDLFPIVLTLPAPSGPRRTTMRSNGTSWR